MRHLFISIGFMILLSGGCAPTPDYEAGLIAYDAGDYAKALNIFRPLAEQGHTNAQYRLGVMHNKGRGVKRNIPKSIELYRKAAEKNHIDAIYNLAWIYWHGDGISKDHTESAKWAKKAADLGDAEGMHNIGMQYYYGDGIPVDLKKAEHYLRKAVEHDVWEAFKLLWQLYLKNSELLHDETVQWYRKTADGGNSEAQYYMGLIAYKDKRPGSDTEMIKWLKRAALQGHGDAQELLGQLYFSGEVVEKDLVESEKWLKAAMESGLGYATYMLANFRMTGVNGAVEISEGLRLLKIGAERDDVSAQTTLARTYLYDKVVKKDLTQAYKWFLIAKETIKSQKSRQDKLEEFLLPKDLLPDLPKHMTDEQKTEAKRLAAEWRAKQKKKQDSKD